MLDESLDLAFSFGLQVFHSRIELLQRKFLPGAKFIVDLRTEAQQLFFFSCFELAFFLEQMHANIELGILAVMRAKMYPHRKCGEEPKIDAKSVRAFYSFMEHRVTEEEENYGDIWGVENWQDLMQWESGEKKNFGMNVIY